MNAKKYDNRNANRNYYRRMYEQIRATDDLKERLIAMNENNRNNNIINNKHMSRRNVWKAAAAVAALSIVIPTGAYAANHYFGISDFFSQSGQELTEEANKLIETNIKNTDVENVDAKNDDAKKEIPVSFTVQEALCDSGTVNIVVEAKALESGKYLLVPDDLTEETDSVESIGIHEDISIGEYAREKGLEILYVGCGFQKDSPFFPRVCGFTSKLAQDGTLLTFVSAEREESDTDLQTILTHTVRPASAGHSDTDICRTSTSFTLNDKSSSNIQAYAPKDGGAVPNTQARVTKVSMEQTEVYTYVTVYYTNPQTTEDDGLYFSVQDSSGKGWPLRGGRGIEQTEDGSYCLRLTYERTELPETCMLKAYDCFEKTVYGQIELRQTK